MPAAKADPAIQYRCPACQRPVQLRRGQVKVAYFAHYPGADCAVSEGETSEHLLGKRQLFSWLTNQGLSPRLEVFLPTICQRPDLLMKKNGRLVAIEFQCSPITVKSLHRRNAGYRRLGIHPVWLLGKPYRRRLSRSKIAQFTQLFTDRLALAYWNTRISRLELRRDFRSCSFTARSQSAIKLIKYQTIQLSKPHPIGSPGALLVVRVRATLGAYPLAGCPLVCHDTVPLWPVTDGELIYWRIAVTIALAQRPLFSSWTGGEWKSWLAGCGPANWLDFPCLAVEVRQEAVAQFSCELLSAGVIAHVNQRIVLLRHPRWFRNLGDKFARLADY